MITLGIVCIFASGVSFGIFLRVPSEKKRQLMTVEIARELYDRFAMGGWEPSDAHDWLENKLKEL